MLWGHTLRSPHAHARDPRDRHLRGAWRCPASTPCSPTPTCRARRPTASSSATSPCSRSTASATSASRSRSSPPTTPSRRAAPPRGSQVDYEPLDPITDMERATDGPELHPERPTAGPRLPRAIRGRTSCARSSIRHGDPDAAGEVSVEGVYETGIQDQAFLGPGVRARRSRRRGRRRHLRRDAVAARRPGPDRAVPRAAARAACASTSPASAARSAAARTSRCRSTRPCSRCTRTAP